jgi:hypothetical protein
MRFLKRLIFWLAVANLLMLAVGIGAVSYSVKEFLQNVQVNTTQLPDKGWVRWQTVFAGSRGCNSVDFTRINEAPKMGWTPAWDYIQNALIPAFGNPPLTAAEEQFCYGDWPNISYVVQVNGTYTTRPLYDGELWLATRDTTAQWKQIGRIEVGAACEPTIIRQTTYEYRFCTNAAGMRGLTASVLKGA